MKADFNYPYIKPVKKCLKSVNSYGAFSLLLSLDVKFVHHLQNNTEHFNTLLRSLRLLVNRFTTDHYREIVGGKIYNQHKSTSILEVYSLP